MTKAQKPKPPPPEPVPDLTPPTGRGWAASLNPFKRLWAKWKNWLH